MTDSRQAPTISTPFIYLKLKSIKDSMPRKIAYPTSFTQLLNTATRIYKDTINVQSLFTEDGILIENLNEVPPGSVILCSELLPNEIPQNKQKTSGMSTPKKRTSSVMSKTSFSRIFGNIGDSPQKKEVTNSSKKDNNNNPIFFQSTSSKRESNNKNYFNPNNSTKREMNNPFMPRRETTNPSSQQKSRKKISPTQKSQDNSNAPSSVAAAKQARMKENRMIALRQRLSSTPQSKLPDEIEDSSRSPSRTPSPNKQQQSNQLTGRYSSGKKQISLRRSENYSPNSPNSSRSPRSPRSPKSPHTPNGEDEESGKTEEEIEEVNNSKVHDMLSKIMNGLLIQSDSREALLSMNEVTRPFISHLPEIEEEQQFRWFNKGIEILQSFGFPEVNDNLLGYDSMIGIVRSIIIDHRFNKKGGSMHRFNIAITGPKKSGKSTFLSIFIQELFLELISTDKWKEYFIFALDMEKIAELGNDIESFYIYMVNATFKQLEYQCPNSSQYFPMITKYFLSVVSLKNPPQFSKPFRESESTRPIALQLQRIADQLSESWNNMDRFNQFITNITMFPKMIADVFNFKRQILIFDNLEACDLFIMPTEPFSTETENFQLATLIIFMLINNDFVISCRNYVSLTNLLLNAGPKPLISDFVSTLDISIDKVYSKYQFNAIVNNETVPLTLELCGGIPSYVYSWISLNEFYEKASRAQGKKEKEEAELFIVERAEELMNLLYEGNGELHVDSVTRTKEK